jgi:AmmeMemoRadiSam system protein A
MLPLTENDQQLLLRMAREALMEFVNHAEIPEVPEPAESLRQPGGVFVTLRKAKSLRGCIGVVETDKPLYASVRQCAGWAAANDPRFPPVRKDEVAGLNIEISVLSPLFDISPENVEVGRHGLLVSLGARRGLLLPQVAEQWNWNREQFLDETCRKAGLPAGAWRQQARVQAFTAEVFEESHPAHSSHPAA